VVAFSEGVLEWELIDYHMGSISGKQIESLPPFSNKGEKSDNT